MRQCVGACTRLCTRALCICARVRLCALGSGCECGLVNADPFAGGHPQAAAPSMEEELGAPPEDLDFYISYRETDTNGYSDKASVGKKCPVARVYAPRTCEGS